MKRRPFVSLVATTGAIALASLAACGGGTPATAPSNATGAGGDAGAGAGNIANAHAPAGSADPFGERPIPVPSPAFKPPVPVVYTATNGVTVWLLERHSLPVVSIVAGVPSGASSDPKDRGGLAFAAASMMDEGAGSRGAIDFAKEVDLLGASLSVHATPDASFATLSVLKRNLAPAFALLGDVIAKPRFDAKEWKRVHDLWINDLKSRATEPEAVMQVAGRAALFGTDGPYGHPVSGVVATAEKVTLDEAKKFNAQVWRPDRMTVVAVGDVTKEELAPLLDKAFGAWKAPATPPPSVLAPAAPKGPMPRFVLVDRADAPQSVIALVRTGVAASDPAAAALSRVNNALGGSFTSRLNQDLREEHGWSYGARSSVGFSRGVGSVVASAAVVTEKTGDALKALLADLEAYAKKGMTDEEVAKTKSQARAELVELFERASSSASRFATDATAGLGPGHEADAAARREAAGKSELDALAARFFDPAGGIVVVVGPRAKIVAQLAGLGLPEPEVRDESGNPKAAAKK